MELIKQLELRKYPRLKPGVNFFKLAGAQSGGIESGGIESGGIESGGSFVGFSHRGVEIESPIASQLLPYLDGSRKLGEIYTLLAEIEGGEVMAQNIILELSAANLLELNSSAIQRFSKTSFAPANLVNSANRLRAESNLFAWHPSPTEEIASSDLISKRAEFSILLFGGNRLALSLFAILQASGFSQCKLIDRQITKEREASLQIAPDQVCGMAIRGGDVGSPKKLVMEDIARNNRLFPVGAADQKALDKFPAIPNFVIATQRPSEAVLQRWMSEGVAHMVVGNLIENNITLGPIVIPGHTPCLNCLDLYYAEQFPHHRNFEILNSLSLQDQERIELELPAAQVALLTGTIATYLIEFSANFSGDNFEHPLIGVSAKINLLDPLTISRSVKVCGARYWQPHIACGCQVLI